MASAFLRSVLRGTAGFFVVATSIAAGLLLMAALFIVVVFFAHEWNAHRWSIVVENESDDQCTIVITLDGEPERVLRYDGIGKTPFVEPKLLITERADVRVRRIAILGADGRERRVPYEGDLDVGWRLSIRVFDDGTASTDLDQDYHM